MKANCPKLCKNCAFPQHFHTWKLGKELLRDDSTTSGHRNDNVSRRFARNYAETVPFHKISTPGNKVKLRYLAQWMEHIINSEINNFPNYI